MAPGANHVIELSDDSDREIQQARRAPAARPKASKPGNKTSRFTDKRPVGAFIDLTDDPAVPSIREETVMSDGLTAKAAALRLSSDAKPNGWDANANGPKASSQKSSLQKRRRDDDGTQRPKTAAKHRRVGTPGDEGRPASIRQNAMPQQAITSTNTSSRPATNSPTGGGAMNDQSASKRRPILRCL